MVVLNRKLTSEATVYSVYSLTGGLNNYLVPIFNKRIDIVHTPSGYIFMTTVLHILI